MLIILKKFFGTLRASFKSEDTMTSLNGISMRYPTTAYNILPAPSAEHPVFTVELWKFGWKTNTTLAKVRLQSWALGPLAFWK